MIPVAEMHSGDSFGELALINEKPRAATITALQPTFCITLTKIMFKKAIDDLKEGKYKPIVEFLKQTPIFQQIPEDDLYKLASHVTLRSFPNNTLLVR